MGSLWRGSVLGAPAGVWWKVATLWDGWGRGAGMAMLARRDLGDARLDWRGSGGVWDVRRLRKSREGLASGWEARGASTREGETV